LSENNNTSPTASSASYEVADEQFYNWTTDGTSCGNETSHSPLDWP